MSEIECEIVDDVCPLCKAPVKVRRYTKWPVLETGHRSQWEIESAQRDTERQHEQAERQVNRTY